jgi:hypothetical protein
MSSYKIQAPGNYPEENIQHTEHGESLKSRIGQIYSVQMARKITRQEEVAEDKATF